MQQLRESQELRQQTDRYTLSKFTKTTITITVPTKHESIEQEMKPMRQQTDRHTLSKFTNTIITITVPRELCLVPLHEQKMQQPRYSQQLRQRKNPSRALPLSHHQRRTVLYHGKNAACTICRWQKGCLHQVQVAHTRPCQPSPQTTGTKRQSPSSKTT